MPSTPSRRRFLGRTVAAGAAASAVAALHPADLLPAAGAQQLDERELAAFAESLELAVVSAYESIADHVSEDVLPVVETHAGHHREHAEAFAAHAGEAATGEPNAALVAVLTPSIAELSGQTAALVLARALEDQIAETHGYLITLLQDAEVAGDVASVLAVEETHFASLQVLLEEGLDATFPSGAFATADITRGFAPSAFPLG